MSYMENMLTLLLCLLPRFVYGVSIYAQKNGYRKDITKLNFTHKGSAFSKLPKDIYQAWHAVIRGYLPIDREIFLWSLLAARDRELAVCRLKPKLLLNS